MDRVYVYSRKNVLYGSYYTGRKKRSVVFYIFCIALLLVSYLILRGLTAELRENLILQLSRERDALMKNYSLKVELSGITKKRYLELKAMELGLKKPKEEEVVVLR
ncbi:MAG: hypothetical protein N2596_02865 [Syntrophorhabdaceae bacterium]|nr:hypothetical protein [Syntrophorhabdaceae bacterium]